MIATITMSFLSDEDSAVLL